MAWEYKRIQVFDAVCYGVQLRAVDCISGSWRDTTCGNVLDLTFVTFRTYRQYCAVAQAAGCACEAAVSVAANSSSIGRYEVAGCRTVTQGYAVFDSRFSFCTQSQSVLGCCLSVVTQGSCKLAVSLREATQCDGLFWSGLALYAQSHCVFTSCLSSRTECRSGSTVSYGTATDCYVRTLFGLSVATQCYRTVCQGLRTLTDGSCYDTGCLSFCTDCHCRTGIVYWAFSISTWRSTIGCRTMTYCNVSSLLCIRLRTNSDRVSTSCLSSFSRSHWTTDGNRVYTSSVSWCTTSKRGCTGCFWGRTNCSSAFSWSSRITTQCSCRTSRCIRLNTNRNGIINTCSSALTCRNSISSRSICQITNSNCGSSIFSSYFCFLTKSNWGICISFTVWTNGNRLNTRCICWRSHSKCMVFACYSVFTNRNSISPLSSSISTNRNWVLMWGSCVRAYSNSFASSSRVWHIIWCNINCIISTQIRTSNCTVWHRQSTCRSNYSSYGFTLVRSGFFAVCMADFGNRGPCLGRVVPNDFKDFIHIDFPVRGLISFGTFARP